VNPGQQQGHCLVDANQQTNQPTNEPTNQPTNQPTKGVVTGAIEAEKSVRQNGSEPRWFEGLETEEIQDKP
jgi:PT repeat